MAKTAKFLRRSSPFFEPDELTGIGNAAKAVERAVEGLLKIRHQGLSVHGIDRQEELVILAPREGIVARSSLGYGDVAQLHLGTR